MVTPLNINKYKQLLGESNYDLAETQFLVNGFEQGFDLGYEGVQQRQSKSRNIPFTVGNHIEMWNKIMKEVQLKCVTGPFDEVPFKNYIQSPIGLVPKAGNKTRLIFHLSYDFGGGEAGHSVNACTPREKCKVKYNDLDNAVRLCLKVSELAKLVNNGSKVIYLGKTDLSSAFRILCMNRRSFCWLVFKATNPSTGKVQYFVDKCLPFGASISCAHYQRFSNSLRHILQFKTGRRAINNYLDDFLFIAIAKMICDLMIQSFIDLCETINIPIALEKTKWGSTAIVFLGILLDGHYLLLSLPLEKQQKALRLLNDISGKKKATVKQLQVLTGYLNFLTRAIFVRRTFNRRIYAKYSNRDRKLKQHHHVRLDSKFKFDCQVWSMFLSNHRNAAVCRPMIDLDSLQTADQLRFFTDASARHDLGMGAVYNDRWFFAQWEPDYIKSKKPSIEYLELLGVAAGVLTWSNLLKNRRIVIFCDNQAVVAMINNMTSSCRNCMVLLRMVALDNLVNNRRVFAQYISTSKNDLADSLSRLQFSRFKKLIEEKGIKMNKFPDTIVPSVWPATHLWLDH